MQKTIDSINRVANDLAKDLCGYAADAALKKLTSNWQDAVNDGNTEFTHASMVGDLEDLIGTLTAVKAGLTGHSNAEANMRRELGLDFVLPDFDQSDDQAAWVEHLRKSCPEIGSKEAFRLAEAEYHRRDGKLPSAE